MASPLVSALLALVPVVNGGSGSVAESDPSTDLTELSLEELLDVEVVTVSRKLKALSRSSAAIYVISQEEIRRSGHSSIPELLRMVPGVHVARINSNSWAIAARGFNGRFNNKMLVMIDGRTVFNSLFSGVFWDVQDLNLDDIERIEVIRGPGGTMWGANAVNGVINIITKDAADTQGTSVTVRAGDEDQGIVSVRYGDEFGENGHWRSYVKWFDRDTSADLDGGEHLDDWAAWRAGFRADWKAGKQDSFTFQGDIYDGRVYEEDTVTQISPPPDLVFREKVDVYGGNLLGRWTRTYSEDSETELQVYYDVTRRRFAVFSDERDTLDLDFQHRVRVAPRHELLWGLGYRWIASDFKGSPNFDLDQSERNDQVFSAFLQDEITLIEDELDLIVGTKLSHNDFTGFEVQPSIHMLWVPDEDHTLWAAVSRAIRTPSVVQHDLIQTVAQTNGPSTSVSTTLFGNDDLGSDELIAYELGWRFRASERAYVDVAAFFNDFDAADNFTLGEDVDLGGGDFLVPVFFDNSREAEVYGLEVAADVEMTDAWKVRSGFTLIDLKFQGDLIGTPIQPQSDDEEPAFIANLRSYWNVTEDWNLDLGFYGVDDLDDLGVPGYFRMDSRLSYQHDESLEFAIGVQNLTDCKHQEFATTPLSTASEIERAFYFQVNWRP